MPKSKTKLTVAKAEQNGTLQQDRCRRLCLYIGVGALAVNLIPLFFNAQRAKRGMELPSNSIVKNVTSVSEIKEVSDMWQKTTATKKKDKEPKNEISGSGPFEWEKGCMVGPKPVSAQEIDGAPTGIAISLAKSMQSMAKEGLSLLCDKIPTQQAFFYEPHGIDLLILVALEGLDISEVATCLELTPLDKVQEWPNLDGSTLTTHEYKSKTGKGRVFLAPYVMPYPEYIQKNLTIMEEEVGCVKGTLHDYVQGTRFYSHEGLNLKIASQYEYMLKVDLDIEFNASLPFNLLHDMKMKGAVMGHTAEFAEGFPACNGGFKTMLTAFVDEFGKSSTNAPWAQNGQWHTPCSAGVPHFEGGYDLWYTNMIIYRTDFFQSEPVRAFGRWMNEFYPGFFRYRWTDQLFFHHAMGLFLGPDFEDYVADYTDIRCFRLEQCWLFWVGKEVRTNCCESGGYFYHSKNRDMVGGKFDGVFPDVVSPLSSTPFVNHFVYNCSKYKNMAID